MTEGKREGHRQRERKERTIDRGAEVLCPLLEPDLATESNGSYSGLHMTSTLGQGLGCRESLVWRAAAGDFN